MKYLIILLIPTFAHAGDFGKLAKMFISQKFAQKATGQNRSYTPNNFQQPQQQDLQIYEALAKEIHFLKQANQKLEEENQKIKKTLKKLIKAFKNHYHEPNIVTNDKLSKK